MTFLGIYLIMGTTCFIYLLEHRLQNKVIAKLIKENEALKKQTKLLSDTVLKENGVL